MGLKNQYREDIERLEASIEETLMPRRLAHRFKPLLDHLLPIAVLALFFVILLGFYVPVNQQAAALINYLNWGVIIYFTARLGVAFRLRDTKESFVEEHWVDFMMIFPAFSLLKEIKIVQALEEFELFHEEGMLLGSAAALRNVGLATQLTRITRIVKRSIGF